MEKELGKGVYEGKEVGGEGVRNEVGGGGE